MSIVSLSLTNQPAPAIDSLFTYRYPRLTASTPDTVLPRYVEYVVPAGARAFFNSTEDPWQTRNIYESLPPFVKTELAAMLAKVVDCHGSECP